MISINKYGQNIDLSKIVAVNGKKSFSLEGLNLNETLMINVTKGMKFNSAIVENDLKIEFTDTDGSIFELVLKDMATLLAQNDGEKLVDIVETDSNKVLASITDIATALEAAAAGPAAPAAGPTNNSDSAANNDEFVDPLNLTPTNYANATLPDAVSVLAAAEVDETRRNFAPTIETISAQNVDEDNSLLITYTAADANDDVLTTTVTATNGTAVITEAGQILFTPNENFNGAAEIVLTITDGLLTTVQTIAVTVNPVNDAPVLDTITAVTVNEDDSVFSGTITSSDVDANATAVYTTTSTVAGFTLNANGTYTFDAADVAYQSLAAGVSQTIIIPVTVTDDENATDTQNLTIIITGTNDTPTVTANPATTLSETDFATLSGYENAYKIITETEMYAILGANDVDVNDSLTLSLVTDSSNFTSSNAGIDNTTSGVVQLTAADITALGITANVGDFFIYSLGFDGLNASETSTATFNVILSDGTDSVTSTVTLTVNGVNDAPTVVAAPATTLSETDFATLSGYENAYKIITESEMYAILGANDVDVNDSLTLSLVTDSSNFTSTNTGIDNATSGVVQLTAADITALGITANVGDFFIYSLGFDGLDDTETATATFNVILSDGTAPVTSTVTLTVNGVNDAPTVVAAPATTLSETDFATLSGFPNSYKIITESEMYAILGANDVDVNDSLTLSLVTDSSNFTSTNTGIDNTTSGVVQLTAADITALGITANVGDFFIYSLGFDGLNASETSTATFNVILSDGTDSVTSTVTLTVNGVNDAPTVVAAPATTLSETDFATLSGYENSYKIVTESEMYSILGANDVDVNDSLTLSLVTDSSNFTSTNTGIDNATSGVVQLTAADITALGITANVGDFFIYSLGFDGLNASETSTATFNVILSDGTAPVTSTVTLTVNGVTDVVTGSGIDGYITNMTVFSDSIIANGILDAGETSDLTNEAGEFTLSGGTLSGVTIGYGGIDISTGLAFEGIYKAPSGVSVLNPITTLLVNLMATPGTTLADAIATVKADFGITSSVDLLADPIASALAATGTLQADYVTLQMINTKIDNTIGQIAAAIEGAGIATEINAYAAISTELASMLLAGSVNLDNNTDVNTLITNTLAALSNGSLTPAAQSDLVTIVLNTNTAITDSISTSLTSAEALESLAKVQIAAESVENELEEGVKAGDTSSAVISSTGTEFAEKVTTAQVGLISKDQAVLDYAPTSKDILVELIESQLIDSTIDNTTLTVLADSDKSLAYNTYDLNVLDTYTFARSGTTLGLTITTASSGLLDAFTNNNMDYIRDVAIEIISIPEIATALASISNVTMLTLIAQLQIASSVHDIATALTSVGITPSISAAGLSLTFTDVSILESKGLVTIDVNSDGSYTVESPLFNNLSVVDNVTFSFDYTATDSSGLTSDAKTVSLSINGTNDSPVVTSAVVINVDENQLDSANNTTLTVSVDDEFALHNFVYDLDVTDDHNFNRLGTTLSLTITTASSGLVNAFTNDQLEYIKDVVLEIVAIPEIATALASITEVNILTLIDQLSSATSVSQIVGILTSVNITPSYDVTTGLSLIFPDASILEEKGLLTIDLGTDGDGSYTVSSPLFNNLGITDTVSLSFDYLVTDSGNGTDTGSITVNIKGSNDVPTISDVSISTSENALTNSTILEIDINSPYALTNFTYDLDVTDDFNFEMATNSKIGFTLETMDPELLTAFQTNNVAYIKSVALQLLAIPEVATAMSTMTEPNFLALVNSLNSATTSAQLFAIVNNINGVSASMTTSGLSLSIEDASILVTKGLLSINIAGDGSYSVESSLFDNLSVNDSVRISFDYTATDSGGVTTSPETITVNIAGSNDAPTVVAAPATTLSETDFATLAGYENAYKIITETEMYAILGANDVDVNDSLILSLVTDSSNFTSSNAGIDNTTSGVVQLTAADITALGITANVGDFFIYSLGFDGLNASETASATFNVILSDGTAPVTSTVTLTVNGVNDAPTVVANPATTLSETDFATLAGFPNAYKIITETEMYSILGANDVDVNDSLTLSLVTDSSNFTSSNAGIDNATSGVVQLTAADITALGITANVGDFFIYSLGFDGLNASETSTATFNVILSDGTAPVTSTVTLTVDGVNDAPTVVANPATTLSETDFATLAGFPNAYKIITETEMYSILGANDVDVNDSLTLSLVTDSSNFTSSNAGIDNATSGVVQLTAADITALGITANVGDFFIYSLGFDGLNASETSTATFNVILSDGTDSVTSTVTLTVNGVNDAPTVTANPATTLSETDFATLAGFPNAYKIITETEMYSILGADDVDVNDSLTLSLVSNSSNFTSSNAGIDNTTSGVVQLTAADITALGITANVGDFFIYSLGFDGLNASETSTATFNVILSDGTDSVTSTVTLTVNGVNDAPIASATSTIVANDVSYVGQLVASDTDLNDTLTYTYDNTSVSMTLTVAGLNNLDTLMAFNNASTLSALTELKAAASSFAVTGSLAGLLTLTPSTIAIGKTAVSTLLNFLNTNSGLNDIKDFIVDNRDVIIANTELSSDDITLIQGLLTTTNISALNSLFTTYGTFITNPTVQAILADNVISSDELSALSSNTTVQTFVANVQSLLAANTAILSLIDIPTIIAKLQSIIAVDTANGEVSVTAEIPSTTADVMIALDATTGEYTVTNPYLATLPDNTQVEVKFDYTVTDSAGASDDSTAAIMITSENVDKVSASLDDDGTLVMGDEKDIDMASLLSNITSNINVADIDSIDLSSNEHILSNLTIADFQEMVSDSSSNTLEIKGENNDIIKLDPAIWLKDTSDTDTNSVVDNADDNFISYKATTTDSQVLTLLIDKDIIVQDI